MQTNTDNISDPRHVKTTLQTTKDRLNTSKLIYAQIYYNNTRQQSYEFDDFRK